MSVLSNRRSNIMRKRLTRIALTLSALAALAVGGSTFASAAHKQSPSPAVTAPAIAISGSGATSATDGDNVQQGDQSAPDTAGSADSSTETQSETADSASETGPSDGPGGYADTAANADTQQAGQN
jgi:hypothetical protein